MRTVIDPGPAPAVPDAERLALAAERCLAALDALLGELGQLAHAPEPAEGRLSWRSAAADRYDERLDAFRERLGRAASEVGVARDRLDRHLAYLRVLADAERGALWPTS